LFFLKLEFIVPFAVQIEDNGVLAVLTHPLGGAMSNSVMAIILLAVLIKRTR